MYVELKKPLLRILNYSKNQIIVYTVWSSLLVGLFYFLDWRFLAIPFLPISVVGTALSFFLGFKNNASFDRLYEARKNYGAIVNDSRALATMINSYIPTVSAIKMPPEEVEEVKRDLIMRHIAWLYAHKFQLRQKRQPWEPDRPYNNKYREYYQKEFNIDTDLRKSLSRHISQAEVQEVVVLANPAAQLLNNQSKKLRELREKDIIEDFRLFELQSQINSLLENQGKNERIKNFPYPLQYSFLLRTILRVFTFLLPFGLLTEMDKHGSIWLVVPFSVIINWIFYFTERNSDYTENPFQGLIYDVPITNITRSLEIDLLQIIGIKEIPEPITAKDGVLM